MVREKRRGRPTKVSSAVIKELEMAKYLFFSDKISTYGFQFYFL